MEILIKKTNKRSVSLACNGEQYVINLHGIICRKTVHEGKFWYHIVNTERELGLTFRQAIDFVESLKIGSDHRGNIYKLFTNKEPTIRKPKTRINRMVYREGIKAGLSTQDCVENPYDPFTQREYWISWKRGYYDGRGYKQ